MVRVAINGFGRIGRLALRIALNSPDVQVVAVNTSGSIPIAGWAHLFRFDTAYGPYPQEVKAESGSLHIAGQKIPFYAQKDPSLLPWSSRQVDVVIESTGVFRDQESCQKHLAAGAKKVIISAPAKDKSIPTYLMAVNHQNYHGEKIIDNGSCTTNCVAPVLKVILNNFGVSKAFFNTIHAYTSDQELQDGSHQDLRRARAACQNIVPTTTGASQSVIKALPELAGKLKGLAVRVPVLVGSLSDLTIATEKEVSVNAVNQAFTQAAAADLKNILGVTSDPLVSSDIIASSFSALVDLNLTQVIRPNFLKVIAWYDNEWAYSQRLIELASWIGSH